jgi:hypothetical protein
MGQGAKDRLGFPGHFREGEGPEGKVDLPAQVRIQLGDELAEKTSLEKPGDPGLGMEGQKTTEFDPGVTRGPDNGDIHGDLLKPV